MTSLGPSGGCLTERAGNRSVEGFARIDMMALVLGAVVLFVVALPVLANSRAKAVRVRCQDGLGRVGVAFRVFADAHGDRYPMWVNVSRGGSAEYLGFSARSGAESAWMHFRALSNELVSPAFLVCPADEGRHGARDFEELALPTVRSTAVSYGLGVNAHRSRPDMVLAADRSFVGGAPAFEFNGQANRGNVGSSEAQLGTLRWDENGLHRSAGNLAMGDGSVRGVSTPGLREAFRNSGDFSNNHLQPGLGPDL